MGPPRGPQGPYLGSTSWNFFKTLWAWSSRVWRLDSGPMWSSNNFEMTAYLFPKIGPGVDLVDGDVGYLYR